MLRISSAVRVADVLVETRPFACPDICEATGPLATHLHGQRGLIPQPDMTCLPKLDCQSEILIFSAMARYIVLPIRTRPK